MTWQPDEIRDVKRALLGTWPGTIVQWGADAIDAYLYVLQARGLTSAEVMRAVGTWPAGSDFPPAAPNLAAQARKDPSVPTGPEFLRLIFGRAGVLKARTLPGRYANEAAMLAARDDAALERARELHPMLGLFVERYGPGRLRALDVDHETYGEKVRRELVQAWGEHCEAFRDRDVAALASGRRAGGLGRLDPLAALGGPERVRIGAGDA